MHTSIKNDIVEGTFKEKLTDEEMLSELNRMKRALEKKGAQVNILRSTLESDPRDFKTFASVVVEAMEKDIELFLQTTCFFGTWYKTPGNPDFFEDQRFQFYLQGDKTAGTMAEEKKGAKKSKFEFGPKLDLERADVENALFESFGAANLGGISYRKGWTSVTFSVVGTQARGVAASTGTIVISSGGKKMSLRVREEKKENTSKLTAGLVLVEATAPKGFPENRLLDLFKSTDKEPSLIKRLEPTKDNFRFELAFASQEAAEELLSIPERTVGGKLIKLRSLSQKDESIPKVPVLRSLRRLNEESESGTDSASNLDRPKRDRKGKKGAAAATPPPNVSAAVAASALPTPASTQEARAATEEEAEAKAREEGGEAAEKMQ